MISVVISTLNSEAPLGETLAALVPAAVDGLVREVIVADGGSTDRTLAVADDAGARIVAAEPGRGAQLKAGAAAARFPWLLFLDAGTSLAAGWEREARLHMERAESGRRRPAAASFRLVLDADGMLVRMRERLASLRAHVLKLPHGNQGLLIPRALYDAVGGFAALPVLEHVDLLRRIGRGRVVMLDARAIVSRDLLHSSGSMLRRLSGPAGVGLCLVGVPVSTLAVLLAPRVPDEERGLP
jgi:glycosyltransferase involved in cell wall biosynthesis